jgi:hypothetical protein
MGREKQCETERWNVCENVAGMIHEGRSKRKVYALCTMHYAPNNLHYGDVSEEREFEMQRMNVTGMIHEGRNERR